MFDSFDTDKSGAIDRTELGAAVSRLGATMSPEEVGEMFQVRARVDALCPCLRLIAAAHAARAGG